MNRKNFYTSLYYLVFPVVFNLIFFLVGGFEHPLSVWISYAFIHLAYVMIPATPLFVQKGSSAALFGWTLSSISTAYFSVEFLVGLVFIFIGSDSYKAALIVQIILAAIYAVLMLSNLMANEHTQENVQKHEEEVAYIKNASSRVKLLLDKSSDKKANKTVESVYDLLHSSPSKSHTSVKVLESNINEMVYSLENAVRSDDSEAITEMSKKIISAVEERNERLRLIQ